MKIVCISDTHTYHEQVKRIEGDVVIHSGDVCAYGSTKEFMRFLSWFTQYPCTHKILVAGNHDWCLQKHTNLHDDCKASGVNFLFETSVTIDGVTFYGTPFQPFFCDWAFNVLDSQVLQALYNNIPESTDFLITHCPPYGILDECRDGSVGSSELLIALNRIKPRFHQFGHIHDSYGKCEKDGTTYINACLCDEDYDLVNDPIVVTA